MTANNGAAVVSNPFHHAKLRKLRERSIVSVLPNTLVYGGVILVVGIFMLMNMMVFSRLHHDSTGTGAGGTQSQAMTPPEAAEAAGAMRRTKQGAESVQCEFRQYPPRRYYGLQKIEQPDFLASVEYIYGEYPIIVKPSMSHPEFPDYHSQGKLCVDQNEWLVPKGKELPFADGTNPSILSLDRLKKSYPELVNHLKAKGGAYVATICMTNSQCQYKDTPDEIKQFRLSTLEKPTVVRTLLLVLDVKFRTILQSTIMLERDAPWGRKFKKAAKDPSTENGFERKAMGLDDARLFIHLDKLWVSYREGPSFGYEQQVLNEIYMNLETTSGVSETSNPWSATIKASESASFCCGRNMALMEHLEDPTQLQSLTWADPVTVIDVDDGRKDKSTQQQQRRRRRQLVETNIDKRKSHFHGTNAFMVYLPTSDEFLGIGHFHRPHGRDAFNPYARFGHHYTHTFFTISSKPPFRLTRLSQEFMLPSKSNILGDDDGEIIQFLSGLEVISGDQSKNGKDYAVIAYGINDCEGAAVYLEMDRVNQLLRPVEVGKEVVDLMMPLKKKF